MNFKSDKVELTQRHCATGGGALVGLVVLFNAALLVIFVTF